MERRAPAAVRWLVAVELTRFRKRTSYTIDDVRKATKISVPKVNQMEKGRNLQRPEDVTKVLRFYGADQSDIDRLAHLAGSADRKTWWAPWTDVVADWLRTFIGLEGLAANVVDYATSLMPALLQTEAYALGVSARSSRVRADHHERIAAFRAERQRRLFDDDPLPFTAFIEESVLDRPAGGEDIMRGQLEHLLAVAERGNIEIMVLPTSVGVHDAYPGAFTLLHFAEAESITYVEQVDGAVYIQDQEQVRGYTRTVAELRRIALPPEDSTKVIKARLSR